MIDYVTLLISSKHFKILDQNRFHPAPYLVYNNQVIKSVANSTKQDASYLPKLTLIRRMNLQSASEIMLTVEASLPKLIFNNNLEELRIKDFDAIIVALQSKLMLMGVDIAVSVLKQADIISVHYSKNIIFKDGSTPYHYIQQIENSVLSSRLDVSKTSYKNLGQSFKWHCSSYEIVFYDKIYDLLCHAQGKHKKAIDRDNFLNLKSLQALRSKKKKFEVLRIEVRLNRRTIIKKLFKELHVKNNLRLHQIFKPTIMRKVLGHYMHMIKVKRPKLSDVGVLSKQQLFTALLIHNPTTPVRKLFSFVGYHALVQEMSVNEINRILRPKHEKNLQRFLKELNTIILPTTAHHSFDVLEKQIKKYQPFRLKRK